MIFFHSRLFAFWPFTSGWMLLWGLAAIIPILIHLWNRRKFQEVSWAAMEFLLAAVRKNSRRIRVEQLILLAVRVLILLLLAVALADPFFSLLPTLRGTLGGGEHHWILVVDGSYSMDYRDEESTRFERAKEWGRKLVRDRRQGDGFTLVLMADNPQVVIAEPAFDADDVVTELDNLELRHGGARLVPALSEVETILAAARKKHPRLERASICFLTDLGAPTWSAVQSGECREQLARIEKLAELVLLDFREETGTVENLAVTHLQLAESVVTTGREVSLEASVQEMQGAAGTGEVPVELLVDGQSVAKKDVAIGVEAATVAFPHRFDQAGEHTVEVRIGRDPLTVDNRRYLSVPVRPSIRVLCVEGKPGAAREVALALEPFRSQRPAVRTTVLTESALLERDLNEFDCVFLCNVGRFGRDEATILHQYVARGGGLIVTLGDQVRAENYNAALSGSRDTAGRVLPARIQQLVSGDEYRLDPLDYKHAIVAPFEDHQRAGLLTVPILKYFRLEPVDAGVSRALAFEGGDPAILVETIGRGRSLLFASSVSTSSGPAGGRDGGEPWNYLPVWTSFVPLIQEMLATALEGHVESRQLLVGEPLLGSVQNLVVNVPVTIENPEGTKERVRLSLEGDTSQWTYERAHLSGFYTAEIDDATSERRFYAVNVDTQESELASLDPELLPSQIRTNFRANVSTENTLTRDQQQPYFRYFLTAVLALVLSETFLAWHFGGARR